MNDKKEVSRAVGRPLTKEEERVLRRLKKSAGYAKKSAAEKARLDIELRELAIANVERKSDEKKFAKNVAVAARHNTKVYLRARWRFLTFVVTAAFVIALISYVLYAYVFVVESVEIVGNVTYSSEELAASSGISVGDRLYQLSVDEDGLEKNLKKLFPYIGSVEMKRVIPNKVVITVTEETPMFVSEIYGQYALISDELRVLELSGTVPSGEYISLILTDVKNAVEGETIEFRTDIFDVVKKAADAVLTEKMKSGTSVLDVSDRFNIRISFDDRYRFMIGDINDIEVKLTLAFEIMKDEAFAGGNKGTIYLDNVNSPSIIIDNSITFD